jgi:hypothetical protein
MHAFSIDKMLDVIGMQRASGGTRCSDTASTASAHHWFNAGLMLYNLPPFIMCYLVRICVTRGDMCYA